LIFSDLKMKLCIDIDDYHSFPKWDCSDVLVNLVSEFPKVKVTLFVTPYINKVPLTDYPQALDRIRDMIQNGNIEVFPHGLTHKWFLKGEFGVCPRVITKKKIKESIEYLKKADIPFKNGYKFPWHIYNNSSLNVLSELNYLLFSNKKVKTFPDKRVIVWNDLENLNKRYIQTEDYFYGKPQVPQKNDIVYYHAHAQNFNKNGIRESYNNFIGELSRLREIGDIEFLFCSKIADEK